jgi:hypothetical protein
VQTPTAGTVNSIVQFEAQGVNWNTGSRVVNIITDDDDALPLVVNNGAADTITMYRYGRLDLAQNLIMAGAASLIVATSGTHAAGTVVDVSVEPAGGAGSTATIMHLFAEDSTAVGTRWGASHVLLIESDDNSAVPLTINDGAADVIQMTRTGAISMSSNLSTSADSVYYHNTATGAFQPANASQTNEAMALLTGATANTILVTEYANEASDHHGPVETDPTIAIFSTLDPATDFGEHVDLSYNRLACNIMETDRATFDFSITAVSAFAGATGANRDGGDLILTGGTNAVGGVVGIVKIGAGVPGKLTPTAGDFFVTNDIELDGSLFIGASATLSSGQFTVGQYTVTSSNYGLLKRQVDDGLQIVIGAGDGQANHHLLLISGDNATDDYDHSTKSTNPTVIGHSLTAAGVSTAQWWSLTHNVTDHVRGIGTGSEVVEHEVPVELADDGSFDLPDASAGWCHLLVGDGEEYAYFTWTTGAVVTLVSNSANVVAADTDTKFAIFDNGTAVRVRNRLGAAKKVMFSYHFTTSP